MKSKYTVYLENNPLKSQLVVFSSAILYKIVDIQI